MNSPDCRRIAEEIWSYWPKAGELPQPLLDHAQSCASCRGELESMRSMCVRSSRKDGQPLRWTAVLPESFWTRWNFSPRGTTATVSALNLRPWIWAPAMLVLAVLLWVRQVPPRSEPGAGAAVLVPVEAVENMEMLERLDMLQHLSMLEAAANETESIQ